MKKIVLVQNYSELGAGTRGASLGPLAIETAALTKRSFFFADFERKSVLNLNHNLYQKIDTPFAKHIESILKVYEDVAKVTQETLKEGNFPLILAADHGSAAGTIAGIKSAFPKKRLGVVWIDAHGDLHSPYTSPSGNMHGMPLASALAEDNDDYAINDVVEKTQELWEKIKNINGICPKIHPSDLVFFGVRDTEMPEDKLMRRLSIKNYKVDKLRGKASKAAKDALKRLADCDHIYVSFDVDVLDCNIISHGTGTPVPYGLNIKDVVDIIQEFLESGKVCCLEVVEVNPCLDEKRNAMAEAALEVLEKCLPKLKAHING